MSRKTFEKNLRFGNWIVLDPYINERQALCICLLCETNHKVSRSHLRRGASTKCLNCYKKEMKIHPRSITHGLSKTKEYITWKSVKKRILNPYGRDKVNYRNIKLCQRWLDSFENFNTDMGKIPQDGKRYSIGRIDNKGDYCPENCRWETDIQQANNQSRTHWITYKGKTMSMMNWSRELNKPYFMIRSRINNYGWTIEDAFTK